MGHKIFISYKYADKNVKSITNKRDVLDTVRTYVDKLEECIKDGAEHVYKGESDGEDLSALSDDTIWEKLKDRIYDSSLTIIMVSPGMKTSQNERDQWIPWEIAYSLKEVSRKNKAGNMVKSASNAMIAVVLPDRNGSYSYYTYYRNCCKNPCRVLNTGILFKIMRDNMFNRKKPEKKLCDRNDQIYYGDCSYIISVKWDDFIRDIEGYIEQAYYIQNSIANYDVVMDL